MGDSLNLTADGEVNAPDGLNYCGNASDVPALDPLIVTNPWIVEVIATFAADLGLINGLTLLFGASDGNYVGFDATVGSALGDSLLHISTNGKFTHPPVTLPNPAGQTLRFSIVYDGTNISLLVNGVIAFPPEPADVSDIAEPYPEIGNASVTTEPATVTINAVRVAQ